MESSHTDWRKVTNRREKDRIEMADRMKGEGLARERFTGSIQPRCISQRDLGWHKFKGLHIS